MRTSGLPLNAEIESLAYDSRGVESGALFFALAGSQVDGSRFIDDALRSGAVASVCSAAVDPPGPALLVRDTARALGIMASVFFGRPAERVTLTGITGTNGKTSCAYILESIWKAAGKSVGVMGTINNRCAAFERPSSLTTPSAVELHETLGEMVSAGCETIAMEVSSHALSQQRVGGCIFDAAVFTNLTRDHLDYHGDEDSYFGVKRLLFSRYLNRERGVAVINAEDPRCGELEAVAAFAETWTYSTLAGAPTAVGVGEVDLNLDGLRGTIRVRDRTIALNSRLMGRVNLSNILAATAAAAALGEDPACIEEGLRNCALVPGRLERVGVGKPVAIVDYAHTPDALSRTLEGIKPEVRGRLWVVFGCGGDRDRGKRKLMGEAVANIADVAILTSDNPRGEDPERILDDIEEGVVSTMPLRTRDELTAPGTAGYVREVQRFDAIKMAMELAAETDVVLVAGKGHEDYQERNGVRVRFDDREVLASLRGQS
ncbi:MAG: UDP-N-acetylmuramoyl-L-alanyl-D-glutamate--2,6-diaminopimelate ligase [Candidatus Binatia bacterium]